MSEDVARIEKGENGYEVEVCDPKIVEANSKSKSGYESPWKSYMFKTSTEVINFLSEHLDSLKPPPDADTEYGDAFKSATTEEE